MKLVERIKNFFYDEEEIEVPVTKIKTEKTVPVKSNKKQPEKVVETVPMAEDIDDIVSERELFKAETTFKFPIIFEEDDLEVAEKPIKKPNVLTKQQNKFQEELKEKPEKKKFTPSQIISPIYGVLGQNYNTGAKPETTDNLLNLYDHNEPIDIDTVIGKAYGKQEEPSPKEEPEPPIDLFNDVSPKPEEVVVTTPELVETNEEIEGETRLKSIDDLLASTDEQDFYKLVDSMYETENKEGEA